MSETAVKSEVLGEPKSHEMTINPKVGGTSVRLYYGPYGSGQYDTKSAEIKTEVRVRYDEGAKRFTITSRNPPQNVGSFYVTIIEAPEQPEIVGENGWLHYHTKKINGKWEHTWATVQTAR